jgi:hypothetical protein
MISRMMLCLIFAAALAATLGAQSATLSFSPALTSDLEIEQFLGRATATRAQAISRGSREVRVTLTDGKISHDAIVQTVNERDVQSDAAISTTSSTVLDARFDARNTWMYNVAAYRLDRLIGLRMVPVSVARPWRSLPAAYSWWIDDVMMNEAERLKHRQVAPDIDDWGEQWHLLRVFDELIDNDDRNVGSVLITNGWRIWATDHTRAFGTSRTLRRPGFITRCDRSVLERLRQLEPSTLRSMLGEFLTWYEIDALLTRRDAIVAKLDGLGPSAIFDRATGVSR